MNFLGLLAGKKTHILVFLAALLNAYMDSQQVGGMDAGTALETLQLGLVSTFKAGLDRLLSRLAT